MSLRTKLLIIAGVIGLAIYGFYPPDQKINLGLDLKGGVHLVLRVHTDDALRLHTRRCRRSSGASTSSASPSRSSRATAAPIRSSSSFPA